jgi:hypothetical protein
MGINDSASGTQILLDHRLNTYAVRSPEFIWAPVYSCTSSSLAFGLIYEDAIGQPR